MGETLLKIWTSICDGAVWDSNKDLLASSSSISRGPKHERTRKSKPNTTPTGVKKKPVGSFWFQSSLVELVFLCRGSILGDYPVTPRGQRADLRPRWTLWVSGGGGWGGDGGGERGGGSEEAEQMPGQLKGPWECDECGQSVKPPLESQYYF